jgi:hypothetical protein
MKDKCSGSSGGSPSAWMASVSLGSAKARIFFSSAYQVRSEDTITMDLYMAWNTRDCLQTAQAPCIEKNVTCLFRNQENLCSDLKKAKYCPEVSFTFRSSSRQVHELLR